ncbi:MAG: hypothetical protein KKC20_12100 [Proteobacteria bacterium]|nr:hypothetical protein [Pseudomonadota bacterium]
MPPKQIITKKMIVEAALLLVKKRNRNIAKALNGSTRPIYSCYETMGALAEEKLRELLWHMWIYTHGLTVLIRTYPSVSKRFVQKVLDKMGSLMIKNKRMGKGRSDYENSCD